MMVALGYESECSMAAVVAHRDVSRDVEITLCHMILAACFVLDFPRTLPAEQAEYEYNPRSNRTL
jgi:hypothetical protein